jgi:hypothetical protein
LGDGATVVAPTAAEALRIKAYLVVAFHQVGQQVVVVEGLTTARVHRSGRIPDEHGVGDHFLEPSGRGQHLAKVGVGPIGLS